MTTPRVSVVIVSWNVRDMLRLCLDSIRSGPVTIAGENEVDQPAASIEVLVVDNASTDGTPDMLRQDYPWVQLIEPGRNTGFTGGNNIGIEASIGHTLLLLNPDTEVQGDAIRALADYLDTHKQVGVVGPQLLNDDGTVQSSRRRFPTLWTAFFESTWLQPIAPRRVLDRYYMSDIDDGSIAQVDWLQGAALLVRREVIEKVGGFDEGFFMYSEELDWQQRIKAAGWDVAYYPTAKIVHYGGKSSEQITAQRHIYFQSSKVRYFRKHHGRLAGLVVRVFLLKLYVWQLLLESAKWLIGHKRTMRRERIKAYAQVLKSGLKGS